MVYYNNITAKRQNFWKFRYGINYFFNLVLGGREKVLPTCSFGEDTYKRLMSFSFWCQQTSYLNWQLHPFLVILFFLVVI